MGIPVSRDACWNPFKWGKEGGHPRPEILQELTGIGSMVYRTDQNGDVNVAVTPNSVDVKSER